MVILMDAKNIFDINIMSTLAGINYVIITYTGEERNTECTLIYMKEIIKLHCETSGLYIFLYYLIFPPMSLHCFL